jgi:hypothetical protein
MGRKSEETSMYRMFCDFSCFLVRMRKTEDTTKDAEFR